MRAPEWPAEREARLPYETPVLRAYGDASNLTRMLDRLGNLDGGPGQGSMSRTG